MDGSSHGGTKICWARGDITKMFRMSEFEISALEMGNGFAESFENFEDSRVLLHRNNSELILLVNPDKECLGIVMEDTSTRWPVSVKVACT